LIEAMMPNHFAYKEERFAEALATLGENRECKRFQTNG